MARSKQTFLPARSRKLPSAIYFESDVPARTIVRQCARIQHSSMESLDLGYLAGENVFILTDPELFAAHLKELRAPNVRVIALSDERFRDARLDGSVYAYLPRNTPVALLERMFDNAIDHMHLVQTRREANDKLALANSEIYELNHIGAALSAEHDTRELMELILTKCREITRADAGSIYLVEEEEPGRGAASGSQPSQAEEISALQDGAERYRAGAVPRGDAADQRMLHRRLCGAARNRGDDRRRLRDGELGSVLDQQTV